MKKFKDNGLSRSCVDWRKKLHGVPWWVQNQFMFINAFWWYHFYIWIFNTSKTYLLNKISPQIMWYSNTVTFFTLIKLMVSLLTFSIFLSLKLLIFFSFLFVSADATNAECLARYVNDSANGNCTMRKIIVEGEPYLCLFAITDIPAETELRYSYGDPRKVNLWWRDDVRLLFTYYCLKHTLCIQIFSCLLSHQSTVCIIIDQ